LVFLAEGLFQLRYFFVQSGSVSIEGSPLSFSLFSLLFGLFLFKLTLVEPSFNFFLLHHLRFLAVAIELLLLELDLLVVFKCCCELTQVLTKSLVFKGKLIDFNPILFNVVRHCLVSSVKVKLSLDAVILLVEEVNLVLQFRHNFLVRLLMIFQIKFFQVLAALVEPAQTQDFVVSGFDFVFGLLEFLFKLQVVLDETLVFLAHFVSSLVRTSQLLRPLFVTGMVFDLAS